MLTVTEKLSVSIQGSFHSESIYPFITNSDAMQKSNNSSCKMFLPQTSFCPGIIIMIVREKKLSFAEIPNPSPFDYLCNF